jgi:RNA polymerase sigma-70 factor, ECF subfamily
MSEPGTTEAEWQALYVRLERPLYNLAYRYLWHSQEAQDAVHDAFLQLWVRRRTIRSDTADRYLWVTLLNLSRKRRRWSRAKRFIYGEEELLALEGSQSLESDMVSSQEHRLLHRAIDRLPEKLRSVLLLTEFAEMRYESIGELLSIPAGTVASRRHLAIKQLNSELKRDCHEHA